MINPRVVVVDISPKLMSGVPYSFHHLIKKDFQFMTTRNRSLLFFQYRNAFVSEHRSTPRFPTEEGNALMDVDDEAHVVIEMDVLPPQWYV
jgi:hypothetical protein